MSRNRSARSSDQSTARPRGPSMSAVFESVSSGNSGSLGRRKKNEAAAGTEASPAEDDFEEPPVPVLHDLSDAAIAMEIREDAEKRRRKKEKGKKRRMHEAEEEEDDDDARSGVPEGSRERDDDDDDENEEEDDGDSDDEEDAIGDEDGEGDDADDDDGDDGDGSSSRSDVESESEAHSEGVSEGSSSAEAVRRSSPSRKSHGSVKLKRARARSGERRQKPAKAKKPRGRPKKDGAAPVQGKSAVRYFFDTTEDPTKFRCRLHNLTPTRFFKGTKRKHPHFVSQSGKKTSNLLSHCRTWHSNALESAVTVYNDGGDVEDHVNRFIEEIGLKNQLQPDDMRRFFKAMEKGPGRVKKELALLVWLVAVNGSFNSIDSSHFKTFLKECNVVLDSKWTIRKLLPLIYNTVLGIQETKLKNCGVFSLTFDLWTSVAGSKYLVVTYHGITSDFTWIKCALDLIPFGCGGYSGFIVSAMEHRLNAHGFDDCLLAAATSDSGANVKAAKRTLVEGDDEPCINHLLKSLWGDVLDGSGSSAPLDGGASQDFASASLIASFIRGNPTARARLRVLRAQDDEDHLEIIAENITRWEGRHNSIERLLMLKKQLKKLHKEGHLHSIRDRIVKDALQKSWFKRLNTYLPLLTAAHVFSKEIQAQSGPNISCVIHYYLKLVDACRHGDKDDNVARDFKTAVSTALEARLGYLIERPSNALKAALLDYRYYSEVKRQVSQELLNECWDAILADGLNLVPLEKHLQKDSANWQSANWRKRLRRQESNLRTNGYLF